MIRKILHKLIIISSKLVETYWKKEKTVCRACGIGRCVCVFVYVRLTYVVCAGEHCEQMWAYSYI